MPAKLGQSGTQNLQKVHTRTCDNRTDLTRCACAWRADYKGVRVVLAKWCVEGRVDPRSKKAAGAVLNRLKTAVDEKTFDQTGERPVVVGNGTTLAAFIDEWITHYFEKFNLTSNGTPSMLQVLKTSPLGTQRLADLATSPLTIERWLDAAQKERGWKDKTWNGYHQLLFSLCDRATKWKVNNVARMVRNPLEDIERHVVMETTELKEFRILEDVEDKLFEKVELLNRAQHQPTKAKLTREQADAIRARVAAGEQQVKVAKAFKVSGATVNSIVKGQTWNDAPVIVSTRGTEMKRRLIGAFDAGLRAGEMLGVRLPHVVWNKPQRLVAPDGTKFNGYVINLPPEVTKGGKTTGKTETAFAGTLRMSRMLEARRFQLARNGQHDYIFGFEDGTPQAGFKRAWRDLFTLAGLDYGRDKGLVWHSTRHEFISRVIEQTGDPLVGQKLARHKDLKTTQKYAHPRFEAEWAALGGLQR